MQSPSKDSAALQERVIGLFRGKKELLRLESIRGAGCAVSSTRGHGEKRERRRSLKPACSISVLA